MDALNREKKYVFLETFGCQMNTNDSERILGQLEQLDYICTDDPGKASVILLNTCSIREKAEHKVYSALGRFKRLKEQRSDLIIGVGGCVAQQEGVNLLKRLDYVDIVFGTNNIHRLLELVKDVEINRGKLSAVELSDSIQPGEFAYNSRRKFAVKAFVTIMRGCNNFCTYCIVPYVRGREASRKSNDIIAEVVKLAASGVKEVTLIGQNVNSYGNDNKELSFASLLKAVARVAGIERVRFTTSHPKDLSHELMDVIAEESKICKHIHLPLQSGSDRILRNMKRAYTRAEYVSRVERLRRLMPDIAITTDIIVGFPGETEKEYLETLNMIESIEFDNIFSFKYSDRPGTSASLLDGKLSDDVKTERLLKLQKIQAAITLKKNLDMVGKIKDVLIEGMAKGNDNELTGRTGCNRIINFPGKRACIGSIKDIRIEQAYANSLRGKIMEG